jgi:hypothetical protein
MHVPRGVAPPERDAGAVTVEAALALTSLVVVVVLAVGAVLTAAGQLQCIDAAREAARLTARGEPQRARDVAARLAPDGAHVDVTVDGDEVRVQVEAGLFGGRLGGLRTHARAVAIMEPGVDAAAPPPTAAPPTAAPTVAFP